MHSMHPKWHVLCQLQNVFPIRISKANEDESLYLVDVIQVGSLVGPVVVALLHPALDKRCQHNNNHAAVLPYHLQTKHTGR